MPFSQLFFLLQQEGYIAQSCICTGLTEVRNASISEKGRYYIAFFQIAIGVERLAKLALILDHMVSNNLAPPGERTVRAYGHDLNTLYQTTEKASQARGYSFTSKFTLSSIGSTILDFLSNFARGARYANLDALASGVVTQEPLAQWNKILLELIDSDVPKATRERIVRESTLLAPLMSQMANVIAHDLENKPLSIEGWISEPRLHEEANRHVVWHLVLLIAPLKQLVCELAHEASEINRKQTRQLVHIPAMQEFFDFLWEDRKYVLRKKKWP